MDTSIGSSADAGTCVDALLHAAVRRIGSIDAQWLLAHVLGRSRTWLYTHADSMIERERVLAFEALVARRAVGEPVAYLTGRRGFWTLDLAVTPDTLIPRPETELLVALALARLPVGQASRIADLGTGSGAIAIALACERPDATVIATDTSIAALKVAHGNADAQAVRNIRWQQGDWCGALQAGRFDLIVSNPPYIADGDPHLRQGDLRFEPMHALASGADGLDAIRAIAGAALAHLEPGGWVMLEHGREQGDAVRALLTASGFIGVQTEQDLENRDRVTLGQRPADDEGPW